MTKNTSARKSSEVTRSSTASSEQGMGIADQGLEVLTCGSGHHLSDVHIGS